VYENVRCKYSHFCNVDGYYYYIDKELGTLFVHNSSGQSMFSYPIKAVISSVPLKLVHDGVYFFSLHKEVNRILINKWLLVNNALTIVNTYDYSSIGLLASESSTFNKFFNRPITYDDWVESSNVSGASFYISNNELLVYSFGDYNGGWRGPSLSRNFDHVYDFKFITKFFLASNHSGTRTYFDFSNDAGSLVLRIIFDWDTCWVYSDGEYKYASASFLKDNTYNYIEFKRYNSNLELLVNDYTVYIGPVNNDYFSSIKVTLYRYRYNAVDLFRINNLRLKSYKNAYIIDTQTLNVDSFFSTLKEDIPKNSLYLTLEDTDLDIRNGTVLSLDKSSSKSFEEVTVTGVVSPGVYGLSFYTKYAHSKGDPVKFSKYLYIFNNYQRSDVGGALYKFDYYTGAIEESFESSLYYEVIASAFFKYNNKYAIGFVQSTNFLIIDSETSDLINAMNMDNIEDNDSTIITIYDVHVNYGSLYRLQSKATYFGNTHFWSTYNYQLSPIRSFVDSTVINAYPKILNADGISQTEVYATIKDQYAEPVVGALVLFEEDDEEGYMTLLERYTGTNGYTYNYYRSGIIPRDVTLSITTVQED
jgi:hypothetical protein